MPMQTPPSTRALVGAMAFIVGVGVGVGLASAALLKSNHDGNGGAMPDSAVEYDSSSAKRSDSTKAGQSSGEFLRRFHGAVESRIRAMSSADLAQVWPRLSDADRRFVLWIFAKQRPLEALEFITAHVDREKFGFQRIALTELATIDPERALQWLTDHPYPVPSRNVDATVSLLVGWARRDADAATKYGLEKLEHGLPMPDVFGAILPEIFRQRGPEALLPWIEALGQAEHQNAAFGKAAHWILAHDPVQAIAWMVERQRFPAVSNNFGGAFSLLAAEDLEAAEKWMFELETKQAMHNAIVGIADGLTKVDPNRALEWIGDLPSGIPRDQALMHYSTKTVNRVLANAVQAVDKIENRQLRTATLHRIVDDAYRKNGAALAEMLRAIGAPEDFVREADLKNRNAPATSRGPRT